MNDTTWIALLRGVNVGGHNKVAMAELREVCGTLGCQAVQSYIQSGNLVFLSALTQEELEGALETAILKYFGLNISVVVRSAGDWHRYLGTNPFPVESDKEGNLVMLALSKDELLADAVDELRSRAVHGEAIEQRGDAFWIHFKGGSARSKLSPSVLERAAGSPVTSRNWRTVQKLAQLTAT